jgi:hypothetical protein
MNTLLTLLLATVPPGAAVQTHDLTRLTFRQAKQLAGQSVRITFTVRQRLLAGDGEPVVEADGPDREYRLVVFLRGVRVDGFQPGRLLTAEGVLRVQEVEPLVILGTVYHFPAEVTIHDARLVEP